MKKRILFVGLIVSSLALLLLLSLTSKNKFKNAPPEVIINNNSIVVYNGHTIDKDKGTLEREKVQGETILRSLETAKVTNINPNSKITILHNKKLRKPTKIEVYYIKGLRVIDGHWNYSKPLLLHTTAEYKKIKVISPKKAGKYKYIIRYYYTSGYIDYGFVVQVQ
ncbi:hypothetical protein CN918_25795 [Priestia megaterium]|nr:hypothetical protein CN918_25795 [Priestia megaterium]